MKLEEVLPAMREGRVALWSDIRYSVQSSGVCVWDYMNKRWTDCHALATDGWTLEPEPKVEWPKNSLGWACDLAIKSTTGKGGGNYFPRVRQSNNHLVEYRADTIMETPMRGERALALNWEPVP